MKIRVALFAAARELAGREAHEVELPDNSTIADLRTALGKSIPEITSLLASSLFSIDQEYADEGSVLRDDQEVGLIPPVSGG